MNTVASFAGVAALVGEPARAAMLITLMDGRALTAGELSRAASVAASTASGHLGQMLASGLLALERQGRHRYYRLASASVAGTLERLMSLSGELAAVRPRAIATGPRDRALRRARLCYDHLAGEVAVGIAEAMSARRLLELGQDGGVVTEAGRVFLGELGIDCAGARGRFCRPCLDWSERRPHIAGAVGRGLYAGFVAKGWVRPPSSGRVVALTPTGVSALHRLFGLSLF